MRHYSPGMKNHSRPLAPQTARRMRGSPQCWLVGTACYLSRLGVAEMWAPLCTSTDSMQNKKCVSGSYFLFDLSLTIGLPLRAFLAVFKASVSSVQNTKMFDIVCKSFLFLSLFLFY